MFGDGGSDPGLMSEAPPWITVNSRKYGGELKRCWKARLSESRPDRLELVGEFEHEVQHPDLGLIRRGTTSHEYFWFDRWYNVFRFQEPEGHPKYYYCNIIMPPTFSDTAVDYVDLDIDLLVWGDGSFRILDSEEFEENIGVLGYPPYIVNAARETTQFLVSAIEAGKFPGEFLPE